MIRELHHATLLILLFPLKNKVFSVTSENDCVLLATVCACDPSCSNDEVFYQKCVERYFIDNQGQILTPNLAYQAKPLWYNCANTNNHLPQIRFPEPTVNPIDWRREVKTKPEVYDEEDFDKRIERLKLKFYSFLEKKNSRKVDKRLNREYRREIIKTALALLQDLLAKKSVSIKRSTHSTIKPEYQRDTTFADVKTNYVQDIDSHSTGDREEVAVPVYARGIKTESEEEEEKEEDYLFVNTQTKLDREKALHLGDVIEEQLWHRNQNKKKLLTLGSFEGSHITYLVSASSLAPTAITNIESVADKINTDSKLREAVKNLTGVLLLSATYAHKRSTTPQLLQVPKNWDKLTLITAVIGGSTLAVIVASAFICFLKKKNSNETPILFKKQEAVQDYQELLRTQMSVVNLPKPDDETTDKDSVTMKHTWNDDMTTYNMDITTGHVILTYMEDHLKNENRLNKEWEALCNYEAEQNETACGGDPKNMTKNRYRDVLPYDHMRVKLDPMTNAFNSDYINASFITDVRNPEYIATQGPLDNTVSDFWQMIWEQGVVVIVNLTKLSDLGLPQCHSYWPEDGSEVYHIYEVHLISEHIWCNEYLVRSLYLKNLQTAETRTITQFHYLTWPDLSVPNSPKPLLEFRRKVNKCYRGHGRPIVVHCNNGVGRTGTYILLDMIINKLIKGAKEIDIAATLEHLRDQRPDMVKTKGQFDFSLTAMAEEVTAILSSVARS